MHRVAAALVPLLWLSTARALDEPKAKPGDSPPAKAASVAEKLKDLQKELQKTRSDLQEKLRDAEKDDEKAEIRKELTGLNRKYAAKYLELAEKNPKDPAAGEAVVLVIRNAGPMSDEAQKAADLVLKEQIYDRAVMGFLPLISRLNAPYTEKLLRGAAEHAGNDDGRGQATLALAQFVKAKADRGGRDAEKLTAEAEKLFETVVDKYADVKMFNQTLGKLAKGELFEMKHLSIGKTVPEIEAEDTDGTKFKLSDYRGKVVLLDFWGNW